ncbi:MAG: precorrin-8X methylmutase [Pseudomonadota bacterium]
MSLFDTHVIVDWSAAATPSPARPSADAIWWAATRTGGAAEAPRYERTRAEALAALTAFLAAERAAGRRVLLGFDFPFGYPAGVAHRITGEASALALWSWLAARIEDRADNANNRFEVAAAINRLFDGVGPFWGRPATLSLEDLPARGRERSGTDHPAERRVVEAHVPRAQPVWKLYTTGSVGGQVLVGLPALETLRRAPGLAQDIAVWPFESGLAVPDAPIVLAEIYPSLLAPDPGPIRDAGQVSATSRAFASLDAAGELAPLFGGAPSLSPEMRAQIEAEEAWILGVGHEAALRAARGPGPYLRDPAEIYRRSFALVAEETDLSRLPSDLRPVATRLVHACGMPDIVADLAYSEDLVAKAEAALDAGAPVLCDCEMVRNGVITRGLDGNRIMATLNAPDVPALAAELGTTRSAAAVELWREHLDGAVVAIGNAPTALFHLLEMIAAGAPRPAAILAFPVGFVGAAESKDALALARPAPFLTLRGRRGGSALAAAAVNALTLGLAGDGRAQVTA